MFSKVSHITLLVADQEKALQFYTKLGFKVHTDAIMEDGLRWLTLHLEEQPHLEICLLKPTDQALMSIIGKQGGGYPLLSLETSNCQKMYDELSRQGITFLDKPTTYPWGIGASFVDLYGNTIYVNQPL